MLVVVPNSAAEQAKMTRVFDFSIVINQNQFNLSRDELAIVLEKEGIMTRKYFDPPLHRQTLFMHFLNKSLDFLKNTEKISKNIISLPLYSQMSTKLIDRICAEIKNIHESADKIRESFKIKKMYKLD